MNKTVMIFGGAGYIGIHLLKKLLAENTNKFARDFNIKNIFFTSSIAPYSWSLKQRTGSSTLYPETAYGISKGFAEKIHKELMAENTTRRLVIVRPSVIFGPKDLGSVYRMIKALKKGTFILPNGGNVIKGCRCVYGLVESMLVTINKLERFILYNYAENPVEPLSKMVLIAKEYLNIKKPTLKLPVSILAVITFFVQILFKLIGKTSDIHLVRVRKAGFPTNTKLQYLIDEGFGFKRALENWNSIPLDVFK
ncbi:NAD-dependent epimerase/dehydratase family protein [Algibacter sp. L1A34]|uniref:NAD-dependent epimerase/dehydratase family protein n=1 Tax=Algibacter sp. L1A34 TaxID=2686365 RepID=UPI00131A7793|nr:NAD-dependent epimerase/dehydratase family protein [Algibacter sp. L1A34]